MFSGVRIFEKWTEIHPSLIKETDPEIYKIIISLSDDEKKILSELIPFFTRTSFFYLFKNLEEGYLDYSFELKIKNNDNEDVFELINDEEDREIRNEIDLMKR